MRGCGDERGVGTLVSDLSCLGSAAAPLSFGTGASVSETKFGPGFKRCDRRGFLMDDAWSVDDDAD